MPAAQYFRFARAAAAAAIALSIVTAVSYCLVRINALDSRTGIWLWLYSAKSGIEFIACIYGVFYLAVAAACRRPDDPISRPPESDKDGPVPRDLVVAYLCCDDLDEEALNSIAEFCAEAGCALVVHDDSSTAACRLLVKEFVEELEMVWRMQIGLLRRPHKSGGKPGAVNYVAESLDPCAEFLLLCDSDSFLPQQTDGIERALRFFAEPDVAIVQLCNISRTRPGASRGYHFLSESIDFNHVFVSFTDRFGSSPFLGHNALLRVSVFRSLGGFAPGQLADDVEFSVRVRMAGYRIRYAPFAAAGERHPLSYTALRRRTAKWAYGCTQVLTRWGSSVMFSRRIFLSEKATFFLTIGYYQFQVLMLFYLFIVYQVLPFDPAGLQSATPLLFSCGLLLALTLLPSAAWFTRTGRLRLWPETIVRWGLTYGSQDFPVLAAVFRCLSGRKLAWVPTNLRDSGRKPHFRLETVFGLTLVAIDFIARPTILFLPAALVFALRFLAAPWLDRWMFSNASGEITILTNEVSTCTQRLDL